MKSLNGVNLMNTIFKFYFQTWIMLGCASAYGLWELVNQKVQLPPVLRYGLVVTSILLIGGGMVYLLLASYSRAEGFLGQANLDGASEVSRNNPDDWAAITWLKANASKDPPPVLLEAPGSSYTYDGRISAFTGFPAVLGWAVHESQWRGNYDEQAKREPDIATIYTTSDGQLTLELLRKWGVNYMIMGFTEQNYILRLCEEAARRCNLITATRKLDQELEPVFNQGSMTIYEVP